MNFLPLPIAGAFQISLSRHSDERGFFARISCEDTLSSRGLIGRFRQSSVSYNIRRGTVRGMHYTNQLEPETKLVRCIAGEVHDIIVDLRRNSTTYLQSFGYKLSAKNRRALYIPAGVAHGFQTLTDDTEILYQIDRPFSAKASRGIRWNDPSLSITWPEPVTVISERDSSYPDWCLDMALP